MTGAVANHAPESKETSTTDHSEFPALRDPRFPVHKIAEQLEPYLRVIVEKFRPEKIILFGSQAYGQPDQHSDVDLLIVRRDIRSEKESNVEIRHALWDVRASPLSFTLLSRTPEDLQPKQAERSPVLSEVLARGVELYAAEEDQREGPC